jgi:hypothetical protein
MSQSEIKIAKQILLVCLKKINSVKAGFIWHLSGNICSYDSEKYFVCGKVMTCVTRNQTEFDEGQNSKHIQA